jgi:hypothetical protein
MRMRLAATSRGPSKRNANKGKSILSTTEWMEWMVEPAEEGGMHATKIDWGKEAKEAQYTVLDDHRRADDENVTPTAKEDLKAMKKYLRRANKRRAVPPWGLTP